MASIAVSTSSVEAADRIVFSARKDSAENGAVVVLAPGVLLHLGM